MVEDMNDGMGSRESASPKKEVPYGLASVNCEEAAARLYVFLDGELTEDRRRAIADHLDRCAPCVDVYGFEAELRKVVADRCKDRVPESLRQRIAEAISHEAASGANTQAESR